MSRSLKYVMTAIAIVLATPAVAKYEMNPQPTEGQEISYNRGQATVTAEVGDSYVMVMPTLDQTGRPAFAVHITNMGEVAYDIAFEDFALTYAEDEANGKNSGKEIRLYSNEDLEKKAQSTAFWTAMAGALAASANSTSHGYTRVNTPYGSYTASTTYRNPYLASISMDRTARQIEARTNARMDEIRNVIDKHTIRAGEEYSGLVVAKKFKAGLVRLSMTINGQPHDFMFEVTK
jgi:hypothetical protein